MVCICLSLEGRGLRLHRSSGRWSVPVAQERSQSTMVIFGCVEQVQTWASQDYFDGDSLMKNLVLAACALLALFLPLPSCAQETKLCLDGFCIGQSIRDSRFDNTDWKTPTKDLTAQPCSRIGCQAASAFRGYSTEDQKALAEAVSWKFSMMAYTLISNKNLSTLRKYTYECDPSARGIWGERRFMGFYRSTPSQYVTLVGLRLIEGELRVYRIARQFPYHNQNELAELARGLHSEYRDSLVFFDGISSNAPFEVVGKRKLGWFARSSMFNPNDLADNLAELVLIDPATRPLLEPTSMPDSGEIKALPVQMPSQCNRTMPLQ